MYIKTSIFGIQHTCINFLIFLIITKIECWPVFKQDPVEQINERAKRDFTVEHSVFAGVMPTSSIVMSVRGNNNTVGCLKASADKSKQCMCVCSPSSRYEVNLCVVHSRGYSRNIIYLPGKRQIKKRFFI